MHRKGPPILLFITQGNKSTDGGLRSISNVIRYMPLDAYIITNRETPLVENWRSHGAKVRIQEYDQYLSSSGVAKIANLVASNLWAYRCVTSLKPLVVHTNDRAAFRSSVFGVWWAGFPVVNNIRDTAIDMSGFRRVKWLAEFALSDLVLMLSEEMCRRWTRLLGIQSLPDMIRSHFQNKLSYIYSVVDLDRFRPVAKEKKAIRSDLGLYASPLLTYVGSFAPKKNQISVIREVLPQLVHRYPNLKIAFVGDFNPSENTHADSCHRAVERLALSDNVLFAGYRDDIERWYQAADMTLLASSKEGLARSMIESLACGTPMISFDVASAKEILEEHNCGVVVPYESYDQLVKAIMELWEEDSLREEMGIRGADTARALFDPEDISCKYQTLYKEVAREA